MLKVKLLLFYQLITIFCRVSFGDSGTVVIDRFDGECGGKNLPITQNFRIIKVQKFAIYFNSTIRIKEDIDDKLEANTKIRRCRSKENLDSCEEFVEQKHNPYCLLISRFSPTYIDYNPKYGCPPRKGVYTAYNSKLDLILISGIPANDYYWRVAVNIVTVQSNKIMQCLNLDLYAVKRP